MGEISYKELIEKVPPCVVLRYGKEPIELLEFLKEGEKRKLKKYRQKTENQESFLLIALPPRERIFLIKRDKYLSAYSTGGIGTRPRYSDVKEMIEKTESPYLIFEDRNGEVDFLGELRDEEEEKLREYKDKSDSKRKTFYVFPYKGTYFHFYEIKNNRIVGHVFG